MSTDVLPKELIERIGKESRREIVIRPLRHDSERLGAMIAVEQLVRDHNVSIRGWDFPHISHRDSEFGYADDFFWSCTDWGAHIEFWKLFKSGQFIGNMAVRANEKEYQDALSFRAREAEFCLSVVDEIYTVSEYFEFAHRMTFVGRFKEGIRVSLTYKDMFNTGLGSEISRPMTEHYVTKDKSWVWQKDLSYREVLSNHRAFARESVSATFLKYGFAIREDVLREIQNEFYALRIGRDRNRPSRDYQAELSENE